MLLLFPDCWKFLYSIHSFIKEDKVLEMPWNTLYLPIDLGVYVGMLGFIMCTTGSLGGGIWTSTSYLHDNYCLEIYCLGPQSARATLQMCLSLAVLSCWLDFQDGHRACVVALFLILSLVWAMLLLVLSLVLSPLILTRWLDFLDGLQSI